MEFCCNDNAMTWEMSRKEEQKFSQVQILVSLQMQPTDFRFLSFPSIPFPYLSIPSLASPFLPSPSLLFPNPSLPALPSPPIPYFLIPSHAHSSLPFLFLPSIFFPSVYFTLLHFLKKKTRIQALSHSINLRFKIQWFTSQSNGRDRGWSQRCVTILCCRALLFREGCSDRNGNRGYNSFKRLSCKSLC